MDTAHEAQISDSKLQFKAANTGLIISLLAIGTRLLKEVSRIIISGIIQGLCNNFCPHLCFGDCSLDLNNPGTNRRINISPRPMPNFGSPTLAELEVPWVNKSLLRARAVLLV
ncbi:hypothetical protein NP233_g3735 [Leucocoprinus birnbaumii]|uniref:Uncharacterized protein n=1 Tax=Leucocoprinus birnbaumii TaxID=56174 RepID=A0AAD5VYM6_9AGAR|nr:hypothetical protein NP233_g3735 [Leucocoprinus birnbaumii]